MFSSILIFFFSCITAIAENKMEKLLNINIDKPRWDQQQFSGRLKHFINITDPRTVLSSDSELNEAKALVCSHRNKTLPSGTTEAKLWYAKKLYDSAFHPDTGEKQNVIGRMSFQVPGGMAITGSMLQFYRYIFFCNLRICSFAE